MGQVFLATDTKLHRNVAIKLLSPELTPEAEGQRRMLREARLIANIDHPNVCTIYEIGEDVSGPYIAMQYIEGETLGNRMRRGPLSLREIVDVGKQVTSALKEAHKRGIVHRDIKPGNIMINPSGLVKVLDFGLAKSFEREPDDATEVVVSQANAVAGTTPYMSPEQLLGEPLDGRSDIFSLGVVLYELASGHRPFDRRTVAATINAILVEEPEPISHPEFADLQPVVDRALAKSLRHRFPDASAMHEALGAMADGQRSATRVSVRAPDERTHSAAVRSSASSDSDPAAERTYLRGRAMWNKRNADAVRSAIALFQETIELDPTHANAYTGLADAYLMLAFLQVIPPKGMIGKARAASLKAIELAPERAEPHASLGYLAGMFEWDWTTAQRELKEAMRIGPSYALAPHWYSMLAMTRSPEEALEYARKAHEIDPLTPIIHAGIGVVHHYRGELHDAARLFAQVIDTNPSFGPAHYYLGLTFEQLGAYEKAVASFEIADAMMARSTLLLGALGHCHAVAGRVELAREILARLEKQAEERYISPFAVMLIHLGIGDTDEVLRWLERALDDRSAGLWVIPVDRRFDEIRNEPRFDRLVQQSGLLKAGGNG
jgi:tetratricopeptide (TPR) repeat protein/tRNA A-37 threonylcarbamoyl transferase component Bud32